MGMWALEPWDNDTAADWYGDFMDRTKLREAWLEGIEKNDDPDVVRAAAALFLMLGRVYVWPIENFDDDLEKTISALSEVAECEEYKEVPELISLIEQETAELKSRRKPDDYSDISPPEENSWQKLW